MSNNKCSDGLPCTSETYKCGWRKHPLRRFKQSLKRNGNEIFILSCLYGGFILFTLSYIFLANFKNVFLIPLVFAGVGLMFSGVYMYHEGIPLFLRKLICRIFKHDFPKPQNISEALSDKKCTRCGYVEPFPKGVNLIPTAILDTVEESCKALVNEKNFKAEDKEETKMTKLKLSQTEKHIIWRMRDGEELHREFLIEKYFLLSRSDGVTTTSTVRKDAVKKLKNKGLIHVAIEGSLHGPFLGDIYGLTKLGSEVKLDDT
jgi:hypothetical protein